MNNQIAGLSYDGAGNVMADNYNSYVYDAEGRICALHNLASGNVTQYIYDASGTRVAKLQLNPSDYTLPLTSAICNQVPASTAIVPGNSAFYLLDQGGNQVTELEGSGAWKHTNAWQGGHLTVTYDPQGEHYYIADPLGTKRVQASAGGLAELNCLTLPWGSSFDNTTYADCVNVSGTYQGTDGATEHNFTGKERDTESGNDYFKYRYYASSMGRWLSPDPSGLSHADLGNPQSLNLYNYVGNRPLTLADLDGLCWKGFQWACDLGNQIKNLAIEAKNKIGYGEWTTDTTKAITHKLDRDEAKARRNSYRKETQFVPDPDDDRPGLTAMVKGTAQLTGWIPDACSGGTFTYSGREVSGGVAHAFQGVIVEHDSESGTTTGVLTEVGGGEEGVGGVGVIQNTNGTTEAIGYGGVGADAGVAGGSGGLFLSRGSVGVYGEGQAGGVAYGSGAYVNVSTMGACAGKKR